MKSDSDSLTENDSFSEVVESEGENETAKEKRRRTLLINRNSLPDYNFFSRKNKILTTAAKDLQVTKEVLQWCDSDDELESELKLKCELGYSKKALEVYENWKYMKSLFERVKPKGFPEEFPISTEKKLVQTSVFCDPKEVTVQKTRTNKEIFDEVPDYFKLNPIFTDLDEKFKTNWFSITDETYELKRKANIKFGDLAYTLVASLTGKLVDKTKKPGEVPGKLNLDSDSDNEVDEILTTRKTLETNEDEKLEESEEKPQIQMSENEGIPDTDADIEVHSVLSKKMKQEILKKATMYREEFSLKSVKTYFMIWKRKVEKLNEKKRQKLKKKEMKREKKMVEKSLIQREEVKVVKKDKAPTKELYYQKDEIEIKLRHGQPRDLSKFIRNCNNIYYVSDGNEDMKRYVRRKKKDRKKKEKKEKKSEVPETEMNETSTVAK